MYVKKLKNENFMLLRGWMVNELKLKGNELLVYRLIHSFKEEGYKGGRSFIGEWFSIDRTTVVRTLKKLTEKGLLEKTYVKKGDVVFCDYRRLKDMDIQQDNTAGDIAQNNTAIPVAKSNGENSLPVKIFHRYGEKISPARVQNAQDPWRFADYRWQDTTPY